MTQSNLPTIRRDYLILALVAAATLLWEVLVTRICALRLAFHYGFLIVSNGLLGLGAAGSLLFAIRDRIKGREELWLRQIPLVGGNFHAPVLFVDGAFSD